MAVPLSQLGHVLAYLVRYGPAGWAQESFGTHAYFPALARTSAAGLGLVALAAAALVGLARLIAYQRTPGRGRSSAVPLFDLLAVLLPLQLAIFVGQETLELQLAGRLTGLGDVPLLYGLAGQLPVACLAASFLRWASVAVEHAVGCLEACLDPVAPPPGLPAPAVAPVQPLALPAAADGPTAGLQRGPPPLTRAP